MDCIETTNLVPYSRGFRRPIFLRIANGSEFLENFFRD